MNYLVPHVTPDHLPLATLACLQKIATTVARTSQLSPVYVQTYVGGSWIQPFLEITARPIPGQVVGTQKNELRHLLHHLPDENQF